MPTLSPCYANTCVRVAQFGGLRFAWCKMRFPAVPSSSNLSDYINWQCIHILSNKKYHEYVLQAGLEVDYSTISR